MRNEQHLNIPFLRHMSTLPVPDEKLTILIRCQFDELASQVHLYNANHDIFLTMLFEGYDGFLFHIAAYLKYNDQIDF